MYEYNAKLFSLRKGVPSICNNMDETGGHYAEWNNPVADVESKKVESINREYDGDSQGVGQRGRKGDAGQGYKGSGRSDDWEQEQEHVNCVKRRPGRLDCSYHLTVSMWIQTAGCTLHMYTIFVKRKRNGSSSSVAQLCPTLCDPMDCSTPDLPVHHQLPAFG